MAPILIAVPILVLTARRFPLTPLAYRLIFVHALILMLGGHYTYAEVPRGVLGRATRSASPGTPTTASATSPRASSPRSWCARS